MQKAKSVLVKVLVLICVLCCSLSLAFGLTGCKDGADGKDGKDGKDGVGIQKVELNASTGKLEVTLTDGSKVVVDDQIVSTCNHATVKEYQLTEGTCIAPAEFLTVCDVNGGCGFAKIARKPVANNHVVNVNNYSQYLGLLYNVDTHVELVGENPCAPGSEFQLVCECGEVLKTDASTAEHVFTAKGTEYHTCEFSVCQNCGTPDPNFVDEHGTYDWIEVVDNGANRCVDGYHEIYVCLDCLKHCTDCEDAIADTKEVQATGHVIDVDTWAVDVEPTLESAGSYKGFCTACGTNATIELPALNKVDYNFEVTNAPKCDAEGTDTYTFVYFGSELAECVFTVTTTASHTDANGQVIDKNLEYELAYIEQWGEVEVDSEPTCVETAFGVLYCKDCTGVVIVKVKGIHVRGEELTDRYVAPTCEDYGYRFYKCEREGCTSEDGIEKVRLDKLPHEYVPEVDTDNKVVVFTCSECGASYEVDFYAYGTEIKNAEGAIVTGPTCKDDAYSSFWYQETATSEKVYLPAEVIPAYGHYFGATSNKLVSGKEYSYDQLVAIFGAGNILSSLGNRDAKEVCVTEVDSTATCLESVDAVAYCSECEGVVIIKAKGNCQWEKTSTVAPDCVNGGYEVWTCSVCGATENRNEVPANGHDLEYSEELSNVQAKTIVFVCKTEGCDYQETIVCDTWTLVDTPSTCNTHGTKYIDYTYTDPVTGLTVSDTLVIIDEKPFSGVHNFNGTDIDKSKVYTYSELVAIFGESNIGATQGYDLVTEVDSAFDCQNSAQAVFYCTSCTGPVIIDAIGDHDWTAWTDVPAECGKDGYSYRTCKVEGCVDADGNVSKEVIVDEDSALAHVYVITNEVKPTLTTAGSLTIECSRDCGYSYTAELPALNSVDYDEYVISENDCANEGSSRYEIDIYDEETGDLLVDNYSVTVTTPVVEHEGAEPPFIKTWEFGGKTYTGYYCGACKKMIIINE